MIKHVFACGMSRSGTTLLTTLLDSHPDVSMGYELLPVGLPPIRDAIDLLKSVSSEGVDATDCADRLKASGHAGLATFVRRCARALVEPSDLAAILEAFRASPDDTLDSIPMRSQLSMAVAEHKMTVEGTNHCGFKINAPSVAAFYDVFPTGKYIYIVRDPRDVVASHRANNFDRSLEHIIRAWVQYADRFLSFLQAHPEQATIVRYEDLVRQPDSVIESMLNFVGLPYRDEVRKFFQSKASVHSRGHTNAGNLQRDFFGSSIDRWITEVPIDDVREVQDSCAALMSRFGYRLAPVETPKRIPTAMAAKDRFSAKRKFFRNEYGPLVLPHREGCVNLTWAEAAAGKEHVGEEILILRHDVDHDYVTALKMAHFEQSRGLRATYCILPSAWYYGTFDRDGMRRFHEMLDCCHELQSLGHEINLHNNFVVMALRFGLDPRDLLTDELRFLRMRGIKVDGTSTHGDALCRELDFRNFELFSESVYESRGGPRTLCWEGNSVELGAVSMADFGLSYEAYDIPRDLYLTDSGGTLRRRTNTRGRAGLRRSQLACPPPYPMITGILTHPVWWDFENDAAPTEQRDHLAPVAKHE